jgi:predicted membrane protein
MQSFTELLNYLAYLLPAVIAGFIGFYFFKTYIEHQKEMQYLALRKENRSEVLPLRL